MKDAPLRYTAAERCRFPDGHAPKDRLAIPVSSKCAMGAPLLYRQECPQPSSPHITCPRADWTYITQLLGCEDKLGKLTIYSKATKLYRVSSLTCPRFVAEPRRVGTDPDFIFRRSASPSLYWPKLRKQSSVKMFGADIQHFGKLCWQKTLRSPRTL